jgi:pimeloyl-ACP methyl ester carboxylesterase
MEINMKTALITALAASVLMSGSAIAAPAEKPVSVVLVHGAFVDASGWQDVYRDLTEKGYEVLIVQNPTISLQGDAEATKHVIAKAKHPVVLVGHSYGGSVISVAGNDPKVRSLVYLAAFVPDAGESVAKIAEKPVPGEASAPLLPPENGFLIVDPAKFPEAFAADVPIELSRFMATAQIPWGVDAVGGVVDVPAWKKKPSFYMVATEDRMVPPTTQREMAKRAGATTIEVKSSHAVMLSHPEEVIQFIEKVSELSK